MRVLVPGQIPDGLFDKESPLAGGRSVPRAFTSDNFDMKLLFTLGLAAYSGSEIGECNSTARLIKDGDIESWLEQWKRTAERVENIARSCLASGHRVSAREAFLRAANYYEASFGYASVNDPRKRELAGRHRSAFRAAGRLFDTPFEPIDIPYEGQTLPAYFLRPDGSGARRPTVIMITGASAAPNGCTFTAERPPCDAGTTYCSSRDRGSPARSCSVRH